MAVISKDLGAVTAYAAAVNRGYTGTKEEFETLMASYATVAQQAAESASNASQSATNASQSATDAETAKGTAQQAATDAQTAQASAQGFAQSAQQSAQSASQSAQNAESAKNTAVSTVDEFDSHAQQALDSVNQAGVNWKSLAQAKALDSEAWAVGKRDGEDVGSSDPAYNNNAKWYALTAATDATTASDAAQTATTKAGEAQASAEAAAESARTLTIDATLTQAGQAADAKKTGDEITSLKEDYLFNKATEATSELGSYIQNNGSRSDSSSWASLLIASELVVIDGEITITAGRISGYSTSIPSYAFFDESMNLLNASYATYNAPTVIKNIPNSTKWVAFNNGSNPSTGFAVARQSAWTRIDALRSSSDEIIDGLYSSVASVSSVSGSYYMADGSKKYSSSWASLLIDIGKVYVDGRIEILTGGINGYSTVIPSYVIFDESMTALVSATATYSAPRILLTEIPENARWIAFNTGTSFDVKCRSAFRAISDNDLAIKNLEDITGSYDYTEHEGYLNENGTYSGGSSYHSYTTKKIPCNEGEVFYYKGASTQSACSALFYNVNTIKSADHTRNDYQYSEITIPNGCNYVVFSSYAPAASDISFGVYKKNNKVCGVIDKKVGDILRQPFTTLPSYFLGNAYYKPLGELSKPYICLVTDDGVAAMNTYTVPMIISKGVPMTFAIMSTSDVMRSEEGIAIVKDAVDNHGCSIAQHGGTVWTSYDEFSLNRFFDTEEAFFTSKGLTPRGAVIPSHYNSKLISAVAGGRFGVVRSGVDGHYEPTIHYDYYTAGARSNLFMLPSYNVIQYDLEGNKAAIEYAIANNKLIIIYIHENSMTDAYKEMYEAVIDYAKARPITFINLGDVASIV